MAIHSSKNRKTADDRMQNKQHQDHHGFTFFHTSTGRGLLRCCAGPACMAGYRELEAEGVAGLVVRMRKVGPGFTSHWAWVLGQANVTYVGAFAMNFRLQT